MESRIGAVIILVSEEGDIQRINSYHFGALRYDYWQAGHSAA